MASWGMNFDKDFQAALKSKLTAQAAQTNLTNQQAATVIPLAESQIGLQTKTGDAALKNADTNLLDANNRFKLGMDANRIDEKRTDNAFVLGQGQLDINRRANEIDSRRVDVTEKLGLGDLRIKQDDLGFRQQGGFAIPLGFLDERQGYMRGTARVPGTGTGDKVPAMLEPGEAVLNKQAAGMIGRDKIAAANKKGNDLRSKENLSRLADVIKMMGMV